MRNQLKWTGDVERMVEVTICGDGNETGSVTKKN